MKNLILLSLMMFGFANAQDYEGTPIQISLATTSSSFEITFENLSTEPQIIINPGSDKFLRTIAFEVVENGDTLFLDVLKRGNVSNQSLATEVLLIDPQELVVATVNHSEFNGLGIAFSEGMEVRAIFHSIFRSHPQNSILTGAWGSSIYSNGVSF